MDVFFICPNTSPALLLCRWTSVVPGNQDQSRSAAEIPAFTRLEIGFGMTQAGRLMAHILWLPLVV